MVGIRERSSFSLLVVVIVALSSLATAGCGGSRGEDSRGAGGTPSLEELTDLQQRIITDEPSLREGGITITAVGIGPGVVEVTIRENDPSAAARLEQMYGPGLIRVTTGVTYKPADGG